MISVLRIPPRAMEESTINEGAQIPEPEILIAFVTFATTKERVLIGDHQQHQSTVTSSGFNEQAASLKISMFERI